jgi:hypothetical protein
VITRNSTPLQFKLHPSLDQNAKANSPIFPCAKM